MNPRFKGSLRALAVDPDTRGFGYAMFEGSNRLVDWGTRDIRRDKERVALEKVELLLRGFEPDVLVVEDCTHPASRRNPRINQLVERILALAEVLGINDHSVPSSVVYRHFAKSGAHTKYEIASKIVERFPSLIMRLPPKRKPWQSEDPRMSIFDAAALALTYYSNQRKRERSEP